MTDEKILELAVDAFCIDYDRLDGRFTKFARAVLAAAGASEGQAEPSTPAAQWRVQGQIDPHAGRYDGERATLTLGTLTDDELANGVFMYGNEPLDLRRALDCDPDYHPPIVWLTGAKERIRWLSRALVKETSAIAALRERIAGMEKDAIRSLIARHAEELEQNDYAYFELAYTRRTGWMAWICSNSRDDDPNRKVIACGQGDTPDEACDAAIAKEKQG